MADTQREKNQKSVDEFRMFDDTFMSAVFDGKIEETQFLIRVILGREDITVIESKAQFFISNIYGRGLRLDIFSRDESGHAYHFEVERHKERASAKRARFTGALVDSRLLKRGQDINEIPDRYTILITEEDVFGEGLPIYHAEYKITELKNKPLEDGSQIIYVNGEYRNTDTPIGRLMHDFSCKKADDILNPILRARVRELKETEGGREKVCQIMEDRITQEKIEMAKDAIRKGKYTLDQIADIIQIPLPLVEELARAQTANA